MLLQDLSIASGSRSRARMGTWHRPFAKFRSMFDDLQPLVRAVDGLRREHERAQVDRASAPGISAHSCATAVRRISAGAIVAC